MVCLFFMDNLQSELAELKQFIAELKADRAANKEKEKREAWTKYVSLSVVIIAVIASIAAQRAGKYSGMVQMNQAQASDQWNFYQAQSIKQHLFEINRKQAESQADFDAKIATYEKKKAEIKTKAEALEKTRDEASHLGGRLGPAVSCFTIAIAMTKKKPLWIISMIIAGVGLLFWGGIMEMILGKS
jgi:nitrogen fixation protein FixH